MADKNGSKQKDEEWWRKLYSGSFTDVYQALVYFRTKFLKKANGTKEFQKRGGIRFILSIVEKPKFTDIALSILANCCLEETVREEVLKRSAVKSIVRILTNLASTSIQNRACRALANIALSRSGADVLFQLGAIPVVINFLSANSDSESQQTAIRALRIFVQRPEHHAQLIKHEGMVFISKSLNTDDSEVLKCTVKAVASLTKHCTLECAKQIQQAQGLVPLVKHCNNTNGTVSEYAIISITNLASQSAIRPELGNAGAIPVFVSHIDKPQSNTPDVAALITALCLCCREVVNRVKVRDAKGLKTLLRILDKDQYICLHKRILASLLCFRYDEASIEMMLELGLVSTLCKQLNNFTECNKVEHTEEDKKTEVHQSAPKIIIQNLASPSCTNDYSITDSGVSERPECNDSVQSYVTSGEASSQQNDEDQDVMDVGSWNRNNITTKKFCIHSPSYQEVQNEKLELSAAVDQTSWDVPHWEGSPRSIASYSPDRYSLDWGQSSPTSDYASQGSWSPVASPSPLSTSPNWSPILNANSPNSCLVFSPIHDPYYASPLPSPHSASSPEASMEMSEECYSPVCEEQQSDAEEEVPKSGTSFSFRLQSSSTKRSSLEMQQSDAEEKQKQNALVLSKTTADVKNLDIKDSKEVTKIESDNNACSSKLHLQMRKRILNPTIPQDSCSKGSSTKRLKKQDSQSEHDSKEPKWEIKEKEALTSENLQNHSEVHFVLLMLSHLSQVERFSSSLAVQVCISSLLDYLVYILDPISRAERILVRLATDYNCFQELLEIGFVEKVIYTLTEKHNSGSCSKCQKLSMLKRKILSSFGLVSESGYGFGVLSHKLLVGKTTEQMATVLAIPHLVRQYTLLQKLLIEHSGLSLLMQIIQDTNGVLFPYSINSLSKLCYTLGIGNNLQDRTGSANDEASTGSPMQCRYFQVSTKSDVHFILDDSTIVGANRSILCSNSEYFEAMLQGSFTESAQNKIAFPEISKETLLCIFHHVYKCTVRRCSTYSLASAETLLDLIAACDRLLLLEFQRETADKLCQKMNADNASEIYLHSKKYNCQTLAETALKYILAGTMVEERRQKCVVDLVQSSCWHNVSNDICQMVTCNLPEGKWQVKKILCKNYNASIQI